MKKSVLFTLWGVLFIVCAGCGFIPSPEGAARWLLTGLSVVFFLPPALLLWFYRENTDTVKLVRNLSALSLGVTALTLAANFAGAAASEFWGGFLHALLVVVSSPMVCSGYWALSLFLWACLLVQSRNLLKK